MTCPKCKSSNIHASIITETKLKAKHRGIIWWLCIGWWWVGFKWIVFTIPALFVKIFAPKRYKLKMKQRTVWVCSNCGRQWNG